MTKKEAAQALLTALDKAILEIVSGAVSASVSSGGGSKSYTRADLATLRTMRRETKQELAGYNAGGRRPIRVTGVNFV